MFVFYRIRDRRSLEKWDIGFFLLRKLFSTYFDRKYHRHLDKSIRGPKKNLKKFSC